MVHSEIARRHAGSNGSATSPGKVFKGKKMPGRMGGVKVTIQNLEVVRVDADNNLLLIKGASTRIKEVLSNRKEFCKGLMKRKEDHTDVKSICLQYARCTGWRIRA